MRYRSIFFLACLFASSLLGDELTRDPPLIWEADCCPCAPDAYVPAPRPLREIEPHVVVDLIDPLYEEGILSTDQGGVLTAPDLRIQAQRIIYTRNLQGETPVFTVFCEGALLINYQEWVLVGDSLYYDFLTHTGYIIRGKTAQPPWFVGGEEILLFPEGELVVLDGYLTTSEGEERDVMIQSPRIDLSPDRVVRAHDLTFRLKEVPLFWLPTLKYDLKNIGRSPFAVKFGWGGFLGSHLSLLYHFLTWGDLTGTARLDGFFGHGLGGGIETSYISSTSPAVFFTRNYYANDIAIDTPRRRDRYRFEGTFFDCINGFTIDGVYDFVSDAQMAADYQLQDFDLNTAERTQLDIRKKTPYWIANLFTRVRVNDFQSVNQKLPSFRFHLHPFEIPCSGIFVENTFSASYLSYIFSNDVVNENPNQQLNFHSGRVENSTQLYRPIFLGPATLTPEAGFIGIAYTDSPDGSSAGQAIGQFGVKLETALSKCAGWWKHTLEPYLHYQFLTTPTVSNDRHFIFTIDDGYERLNLFRVGMSNSLYVKNMCGITRPLWVDMWTNVFLDESIIPPAIPKGYLTIEWEPYSNVFVGFDGGWNFRNHRVDYHNTRLDWTLGENFAIGVEYRYRSVFDWRKADFYNFILDVTRSQTQLLNSALSDRRNTFLFRTFLRFNPDLSGRFTLRRGWKELLAGRPIDDYLEYQVELFTTVFDHWLFTAIYEKREADDRYSISLKLKE